MSILKYDKVVLIKEFGKLKTVGETYEVANITETSFVLRDTKTKVAVGVINIKDFEEYFNKAEDVKGWTPWTPIANIDGSFIAVYRTNFKKVQVRFEGYRAEASCNTMDDFNLFFGIKLAITRCRIKYLNDCKQKNQEMLKEINTQIKNINSEIKESKNTIKKMIDSLEEKTEK